MSVWEDIKDRVSVEEVISDYIPITNAGSNYKAVCPFHQEKTPSLMISPSKGIWHCFGCGEGGDIFSFVSKIENIEKQETLKKLAKKAGVQLPELPQQTTKTPEQKQQHQQMLSKQEYGYRTLSWAGNIYHKILLKMLADPKHPVTIYCRQRNLTQSIIEAFGIGYAPKSNTIKQLATKHSLNQDLLLEVGLLKQNDKGVSDKFKDRLMIPIQSGNADTVGFTGRVLPGDTLDRPKYLNSSQSVWFNKSKIWFGLHLARPAIIQSKSAIIVEGNMDVVSCHQAGLKNAIASQGTSFTIDQLRILKRFTKNLDLAFDNDTAGILAGRKFFLQAASMGFIVNKVVIPEEYKDIDEYLNSDTAADSSHSIQLEIIPYFEWYIRHQSKQLRSGDMNLQKQSIIDCTELIAVMDPISREQAIRLLAQSSEISPNSLQTLIPDTAPKLNNYSDEPPTQQPEVVLTARPILNAWKNYLAANYQDTSKTYVLSAIFEIVRNIDRTFDEYDGIVEYIEYNEDELEYIANNIGIDSESRDRSLKNQLMLELDKEISFMTLQPGIIQKYIEIKQLLN